MAFCTIGVGFILGLIYVVIFMNQVRLGLSMDNLRLTQMFVSLTGTLSATVDIRNTNEKSKQNNNMDFLLNTIFVSIVHTMLVTSIIDMVGGKIRDHAYLFCALQMVHLFQTFYQVVTKKWLGALLS